MTCAGTRFPPGEVTVERAKTLLGQPLEREHTLADLLRRPNVSYDSLRLLPNFGKGLEVGPAADQVDIQAKYRGYIERQKDEVQRLEKLDGLSLPPDIDFSKVSGLSAEARQKLAQHRGRSVAFQASRRLPCRCCSST
jgi:tRNA uridine 5-carboxymethylaminomethyl modification enzyme